MKSATYNLNSESFVTENDFRSTFELKRDNSLSRSEKTITKGTVRFVLGMVYFVALMYFLFILLT